MFSVLFFLLRALALSLYLFSDDSVLYIYICLLKGGREIKNKCRRALLNDLNAPTHMID